MFELRNPTDDKLTNVNELENLCHSGPRYFGVLSRSTNVYFCLIRWLYDQP